MTAYSVIFGWGSPSELVYEDETICSFLTIGPVNPGHVLVIPKQHRPFLSDLDEETGMHFFKITMHTASWPYSTGGRRPSMTSPISVRSQHRWLYRGSPHHALYTKGAPNTPNPSAPTSGWTNSHDGSRFGKPDFQCLQYRRRDAP